MIEKKKALIEEFKAEIKTLENISKAIHSKGVIAVDGVIEVKMSPNQLKELADVKSKIFGMKRELLEYEDEVSKLEQEE